MHPCLVALIGLNKRDVRFKYQRREKTYDIVQMASELVTGEVAPVLIDGFDGGLETRANIWLVPLRFDVRRLGLVVGMDG